MLIGTAGHIDHGKTTLVKALTGVDADRLPEEKARGITLDLGYAYTPLADGSVLGFVDVPGHEKLIHNMLAGATGIDFVLLVVAADDGPMPQTHEHLELLDLLGLSLGAVALTKCDAVSAQRLAEVTHTITQRLIGTGLAGSPVFPLSGKTGEGVAALRRHLELAAHRLPPRPNTGRFRLAVDRCFTLNGIGTVVTGTAHSGKVGAGETASIAPPGVSVRVRSLHVQGRPAQAGQAGERCALALAGDVGKKTVMRGMWLVDPALAIPLTRFQGELRIPAGGQPLKHLQAIHVHLGAANIPGRVALLDCTKVGAGETALIEIQLERETLALRGDRFILRDSGLRQTLAGGRVLDIFPPTRHKRSAERLALLDAMRHDDPAVTLAYLAKTSTTSIDLTRFRTHWNLSDTVAAALWAQAGLHVIRDGETQIGLPASARDTLTTHLLDTLAREHERTPDMIGVERERLRRMTSAGLPRPVFDALSAELLATGRIAKTGAWLCLPGHRAHVSAADRDLFNTLKPRLDAAPFNPPRVRDISKAAGAPEDTVRQLFKRLACAGELYPVAHDHYFTAAAVAELAAVIRRINDKQGAVRAATLRDALYGEQGGGRKVAIHILEFFDRIGYTRRVRDDHRVRRESVDHDWINA